MNRKYSQQELQQFIEAEQVLRTRGLIVDEKDGKEFVDHNAERIAAYFDLNFHIPISVQTVLKACDDMRDQMRWKSEDQTAFENIYTTLSPQERQAFDSWLRPQRLINNDRNNALILEYLKLSQRYEVNHRTLLQASVDRIPLQLEWQPILERVDIRQHQDTGSFAPKTNDRSVVGGRKNHAYQFEGNREVPKPAAPDAWQEMCANILLGSYSHSQQAALKNLYDAGAIRGYRAVYAEMAKLRSAYQRVGSLRGV